MVSRLLRRETINTFQGRHYHLFVPRCRSSNACGALNVEGLIAFSHLVCAGKEGSGIQLGHFAVGHAHFTPVLSTRENWHSGPVHERAIHINPGKLAYTW